MRQGNIFKTLLSAGALTAIASSICCIAPLVGLVAGTSGLASSFAILTPARPYLIVATILALAFAWYQNIKSRRVDACGCEQPVKSRFLKSKKFLALVSIFSLLMMAFPYYSDFAFASNKNRQVFTTNKSNSETAKFTVEGMTCKGCQGEIRHEVDNIKGIIAMEISYTKSFAIIQFDNTKTRASEIEKAISSKGYVVSRLK